MNLCTDYHFLEGILIIKNVLFAAIVIIPCVLIIVSSIDAFKGILKGDAESTKNIFIMLASRLAAVVIIFCLPSLINIVFGMFDSVGVTYSSLAQNISACYENANSSTIASLKETYQALLDAQEESTTEYYANFSIDHNSSGEFLEVALELWQQIYEAGMTYGGTSIPVSGSVVDCSAYVSWVLYEYGYTEEFAGAQHTTLDFLNTDWNDKYGWTEISITAGQDVSLLLEPGDILVRDTGAGESNGHMNIIASVEDGIVYAYDCGSASNWTNSGGQAVDKTAFATTDNRAGKIIRVTAAE